jgi:hypothetical protein
MKTNIFKTNIIYFARKANSTYFNYFVGDLPTDYVKDIGVTLDNKLYFHRHVDYLHSRALKLLGLILFITYFSPVANMKVLYIALICSMLE